MIKELDVSYLKRDESATNRLLINPIEVNSGREFAAELIQQNNRKTKLTTDKMQHFQKCDTRGTLLLLKTNHEASVNQLKQRFVQNVNNTILSEIKEQSIIVRHALLHCNEDKNNI